MSWDEWAGPGRRIWDRPLHLSSHDAVPSVELWCIHVHGATFALRHAPSTT